ncbi:MAG TPA: ATP-binding protein [Nocardioidaceae bacterium]|nr:ATP-binding protein [Nocardioidaceae bacterium]
MLPGTRPATGTATSVTVSIARDPALVRTVRLVAAAVARRTTGDEDFVEEFRLAVGEACALLVGPEDARAALAGPVQVSMRLEDRLRVVVRAAGEVAAHDAPTGDIDGVEPWALLRGLIEDFEIRRDRAGTALSMSWPLISARP